MPGGPAVTSLVLHTSRERNIQGETSSTAWHGLTVALLPSLFLFLPFSNPRLALRPCRSPSPSFSKTSLHFSAFLASEPPSTSFPRRKKTLDRRIPFLLTSAIATQVPPARVLLVTLGSRTSPLQFCRSQSLGPQQRLCPHDRPRCRELLPRNASRRSVAALPSYSTAEKAARADAPIPHRHRSSQPDRIPTASPPPLQHRPACRSARCLRWR